jgi:hypothetical protein
VLHRPLNYRPRGTNRHINGAVKYLAKIQKLIAKIAQQQDKYFTPIIPHLQCQLDSKQFGPSKYRLSAQLLLSTSGG